MDSLSFNFNSHSLGIMIRDEVALADLRAKWSAVQTLTARGPTVVQIPGYAVCFPPKDPRLYNLPFLLAYAALEQLLETLADEGTIPRPSKKPTLCSRMEVSQFHLPWQSFDEVDEGRRCRNALAHDATLLTEEKCLHYIRLVENELQAWGIL